MMQNKLIATFGE